MLELILLLAITICIFIIFYKQSVSEFRINQIQWVKRDTFQKLTAEKIPIVISDVEIPAFWNKTDVSQRSCYEMLPIFDGVGLYQWMIEAEPGVSCPWQKEHAKMIAEKSGLPIWAERWFDPFVRPHFGYKAIRYPIYSCWAGDVGLMKTTAPWTALFTTEGEITVSIMPQNLESALPKPWKGLFLPQLTSADTPFISDVKFLDIVLRPGTCLFMPAHWFTSWSTKDEDIPMACMIEYHTPISYFLKSA
jgi:hypothetical protein